MSKAPRLGGPEQGSALELISFSPKELERMARREYQDPPLKKTKGKNSRWYVRVRKRALRNGEVARVQVREYLGFCKEVNLREAQRARVHKLAEINKQMLAIPSEILLKDFVLVFNAKHLPTLGHGTQKKYRIHLANHVLPAFGGWKLCDIKTEEIQDFLNKKKVLGLSWWTRSDLRNLLSGIFKKAEDFGYWRREAGNPVERATCGRPENKREKRILNDDQVIALLEALPAKVGLILKILDSTGMRISEVLGLRWKNVDLDAGWIKIEERFSRGDTAQPKTAKSRRPLPLGLLAEDLRRMNDARTETDQESYVFTDEKGRPLDDRNLNQHFLRKTAKRLGFYWHGFGFHSFRRGQISGVQALGASSIEAATIAGHSRPSMTHEYTVMDRKRQEELVLKRQQRLKRQEDQVA